MEAMSYGKNCLVSNIEENMQVAGSLAYSFEKSNVNDLADKLNQALKGVDRKDENEISNYVLQKYSWDDVISETEKLYKNRNN